MKKLIAWLLVLALVVGVLPAGVLAVDTKAPQADETAIPIYEDTSYSFAERAADLVARMSLNQKGSQMISSPAPAINAADLGGGALNVPATKSLTRYYWWNEGLHGYNRIDNGASSIGGKPGPANSVSYPQSLTVGSTWNPELYYREALQVSDEIRERTSINSLGNAIDLNFYSPTVNLQRDPRWGRNEESYSEDPYLTVKMGSQYVLGLEGKDQDGNLLDPDGYYKLHSTIKHFVANNSESNRLNGGATTSLEALRNYYLAPYRGIIKATDVSSVMTAYSSLNGEPCSFSSYLMETMLRQTYGFSGHITSDCDAVGTMSRLNYTNPRTGAALTNVERLAGALAHGEDLECNGGYTGTGNYSSYASQMVSAGVETDKGLFTENTMDISLHRLLTARISTGEFDDDLALTKAANDRIAAQKAATSSAVYNQTPERLAIVDQVNNEGVVMLQNKDNFLPLSIPASGDYKVVIVGAWQTNMYLGLYSANETNTENQINIQKGITDAIKAVNPDATFTYITSDSVNDSNQEVIAAADLCVVVGGANNQYSAEDRDRNSIAMNNNQAAMFSQVGKWNPNTVAVMEYCGPVETYTFKDDVKAILWSSFGGLHKGVGFGNIITGKVNPSGRLTATWFRSTADLPDKLNYDLYQSDKVAGRTYMYYTGDAVEYPFGYGLSFTSFEYSNLKIDKTTYDANDTVKVTFDVKNTGSVAGKEVAQLYIAQPDATAANRPIRQLKGFDKIELAPGETKTVTLEVAIPDLAYYSEAADCTAVDTGKYQVQVGKDSAHADLKADFTVTGEMDVYPEILTVKANAVGDAEKGIEERLIYDKGAVINPQLTVAMNNEKLYGYIIKEQLSPIKQMKSTALPEGMTFTYTSNRPEVVKVEGDEIKAVGAGVATITVTGKLGDTTVTTDFVVYVEASAKIDGITVNGKPLEGFDRETFCYELNADDYEGTPVVAATAASDEISIEVTQVSEIPGVAVVTATNTTVGIQEVYRIGFGKMPVSTDFSEGWEAAQAKGWKVIDGDDTAVFDENGLTITPAAGSFTKSHPANLYLEPGSGAWVAQTHVTLPRATNAAGQQAGLVVYDSDENSIRIVTDYNPGMTWGTWVWGNSPVVRVYKVEEGSETQVASVNLNRADVHLQIIKDGDSYECSYSADGESWTVLGGKNSLTMALPHLGVVAAGTGYTATFDGINIVKLSDLRPALATLTVDDKPYDAFDPAIHAYNEEVAAGETHVPVVAATPADPAHTVTIEQLSGPTGTAKITVTSPAASAVYTISFNVGPVDSYFAAGKLGDEWTIEKELPEEYQLVKGEGLKLLTQVEDFYQTGANWHNAFTMPAQGNWTAVAKAFYPVTDSLQTYQQLTMYVWQDEDNYVRINCQESRLFIEPGVETDGTMSTSVFQTANATADTDGTMTIYFQINKLGNEYTLAYSQDGTEFKGLGSAKVDLADPKIVLAAGQNSSNEPVWLNFEYVAITSKDGVDANADHLTWACQNVADYVAADLPAETEEDLALSPVPHGYTVSLESSNPAAIDADGKVTIGTYNETVTVTVKVSDGNKEALAEATVKVPGRLGERPIDKTDLKKAIEAAEILPADDYTDDSYAPLDQALKDAYKVLNDDKATLEEVKAAIKAIEDAKAGLVPMPDTTELEKALADGTSYPEKGYTADSYAALKAALEAGRKALSSESQEEVDAATQAIRDAIAALKSVMHTVTFNFGYPDCPDPVTVQVRDGEKVKPIDAPDRPGYVFSSWGTQRSFWGFVFTIPYNFDTPVTADLNLTASWDRDWSLVYSLAEEYEDYFAFGNFGTMQPNGAQVTREYNTYSGNSGKMTYNFGENESKAAYDEAVAAINADTTLTEAEKAEKIKEADGVVLLGANNPLAGALNAIQQWNEEHPEGPKKYYRQHVLFWHGSEQNPAFYHEGFDREKPLASVEVMNARIDSYVEAMFKRYQPWDDIIMSWDVVNEALDDYNGMVRNGWDGSKWGETTLDDASNQSSAWGTIYRHAELDGKPQERLQAEAEWIRVAFASARKWQKELGVHWKLYYNDYMNSSMLYEPKMTNTINVLKPIYEAGNIDGYGMQARLSYAYPTIDLLREQIELGLTVADEVSFSEADVRTDFEVNPKFDPSKPTVRVTEGVEEWDEGGSGSYSRRAEQNGNTYDVSNGPVRRKNDFDANDPETQRLQADYWADLVDIMLEKADEGKVGAIAIDGTSDGNTFNRNTGCHIWDSSTNEKPAFFALIGAANRHTMANLVASAPADSEEAQYTAESWKAYAEAKKAAEELQDVRIYTAEGVEAVKQAIADLQAAIDALEKDPNAMDKTELEKAIEEAEKLDPAAYTDESAKALAEAIAAAKKALEEAKTQADLDAAKAALEAAIKALEPKPTTEPTPTPTPGDHDCPGAKFTDMPAYGYWSHDAIDWAILGGITQGTSETTFGPGEGCTRAQVVTFLWRAAKQPEPTATNNPFTDVKESDYFYKAVLWAVEKGITLGTDPDKFSPGATCTRAQIVTFLYRYEGEPETEPDDSFTDVKPGDYFAAPVAWAVKNGITQGTDAGKFSPADTCTREQVVTFLYRDIAE